MERANPHKRNTLAAALLLASLLFSTLWSYLGPRLIPDLPTVPQQPTYSVVGVDLLFIGLCYAIWRNKRWAVWVYAILFALQLILPALDYARLWAGFQRQPLTLLPFLVSYLLQGYALWLLLRKGQAATLHPGGGG